MAMSKTTCKQHKEMQAHNTHQHELQLACLYNNASWKSIILTMTAARAYRSHAICQVAKSSERPPFGGFTAEASGSNAGSTTGTNVSHEGGKNLTSTKRDAQANPKPGPHNSKHALLQV
jgi:hypothetical protein